MRANLDCWQLTGPLLTDLLNVNNSRIKYIVAYHKDNKVNPIFSTNKEEACINFNIMSQSNYACIIYSINDCITLNCFGNDKYIDECKNYVKNIYTNVNVYPAHFFYPISWLNINDNQLHTKMELNPDSYMFHYGISTNTLNY